MTTAGMETEGRNDGLLTRESVMTVITLRFIPPFVRFCRIFAARKCKTLPSASYRMRAEQPGSFSALPAKVEAMYAPELKGNSDELKLEVVD